MTEEEARAWATEHYPAAVGRLEQFAAIVTRETERQNLISPSTIPLIWSRHVVDSAQLVALASADATRWMDIGTGAGFPGIVAAILFGGHVTMVEPRAKRALFLREVVSTLGLNATMVQSRVETVKVDQADIISARAVATVDALLTMTAHLRGSLTTYLLPRGRTGEDEIVKARAGWHGTFHVEQSITDPASTILIATGVRARCSASR
ncbi:16S rRNA (guanine(527)-N(7))-methyltransferase RsmG [Sphingomonas sp.]|uniref:16S rRNA (guanine(527)-N(7))-methyltransferase RsmG n=1 Tax=Sphingomonas sp. TaxID=28214 RepID=UPI0035C853C1